MANGAGKPKPAFLVAVLVVVAGLCGLAFYRCNAKKSSDAGGTASGSAFVDPRKDPNAPTTAENPDPNAVATTVKEYNYTPAQKLKPVEGTSSYTALGPKRTVRFAINTWAGWAPIFWANGGGKPGKVWKDAKGKDFLVELVQADDPVAMGDQVANGVHIGWATVDMLPLIIERLKLDPRTMPRVFQQVDWSNGGDGIVVRNDIKNIADLRGKTVVLAQNSPSHYFLLNMLLNGGVQPTAVKKKFTDDAFQAAAAFNQNSDIAAVVTWAPDIYTLSEAKGNRMLVSTLEANKLIADVWFARADFARDHPDIIEGLVRGILDATEELTASDEKKTQVGDLMDAFFKLDKGTGVKMLADAHWTNYAENRDFFLVSSNPTNFERVYNTAVRVYAAERVVNQDVTFDQVMDFSVIKKLGAEEKYAKQQNTYEFKFTPASSGELNVEDSVVTKTVSINFFPNSYEVYKKVPAKDGSGNEVYYDGNVEYTIEEIAKLAGSFGAARIVIQGHTDASMKGQADESLVKDLSLRRANAVKEALVNKFKMNPDQFKAEGLGWSRPADSSDASNHQKNRRVEIQVVPAEKQP